jgi:hypothetical protein
MLGFRRQQEGWRAHGGINVHAQSLRASISTRGREIGWPVCRQTVVPMHFAAVDDTKGVGSPTHVHQIQMYVRKVLTSGRSARTPHQDKDGP